MYLIGCLALQMSSRDGSITGQTSRVKVRALGIMYGPFSKPYFIGKILSVLLVLHSADDPKKIRLICFAQFVPGVEYVDQTAFGSEWPALGLLDPDIWDFGIPRVFPQDFGPDWSNPGLCYALVCFRCCREHPYFHNWARWSRDTNSHCWWS